MTPIAAVSTAVQNGHRPTAPKHLADTPTEAPVDADRQAVSATLRRFTNSVVWALSVVVTVLAATGQVEFAEWAGIHDVRKYLVPAGLELVAIGFLLIGYVQGRRGYSPAPTWLLASAVGAFAVYTNVAHAGERAGLLYGGFSAIALVLWFVKLAYQYKAHRRVTRQAGAPTPNFGSLWLLNPRLAWRGLLVAKRLQVSEVEESLKFAEVWIAVFDDANRGRDRAAKIGGRLRRRTAWRTVQVAAGHPVADLPSFAEVQSVEVVDRPTVAPKAPSDRRVPTGRRKPSARRRQGARPTVSRGSRTDSPTDSRQGARPTERTDTPADSPTDRPSDSAAGSATDSHKPAAVANAALLRKRYGVDLPTEYRVRTDTGWSRDRAQPAIAAYRAGADLTTDTPKE